MLDLNRLRLMNMFGGSDQGDDGSMDYSPDAPSINTNLPSKWTAAPVEDVPSGQSPQNPFAAQIFRQSTEPSQPDDTPKTETDWAAKYRELYHPSNVAQDRLNQLLDNFPEEEKPSFARKLAASMAGFGKGGLKDAEFILDEPNRSALERFKTQATPFEKAADNERQSNVNERTIAQQTIAAQQNQQKIDETARKDRETAAAKQQANELMAAKQNGYTFTVVGNHYIAHMPDGTIFDTGYDATNHTPIEVANITAKSREKVAAGQDATKEVVAGINQTGANQRAETGAASREIYNIPDPNDPTKQIAVRIDPMDGKVKRVTLDDQPIGPAQTPRGAGGAGANSPGTLTTQTKNMMQGAQMMLPIVTDVGKQAADLEKRNLFGPVMSRVRNVASKVGTTGNTAKDAKSLEDFATALQDPSFNPSDDFAVGNFLASLGFLASGAARVHSRTGGSMGMITYVKSLLTSETSLDMFNGKLMALQKLMTDYATGPGGSAVIKKTPADLDKALDKIFGKPQGD